MFFRFAAQRPLSIFRSSLSAGRAAALAAIALLPAAAAWAQPVDERLMTTVAGGASGDGGAAIQARLRDPYGVAVDGSGNLYIADTDNHRIRKVDAGTGNISTVAGDGTGDFGGDGGAATAAQLEEPFDVVVDGSGNLYIADRDNDRIRKVDAGTGNISTVAGDGTGDFGGDGGAATAAQLEEPFDVVVDGSGNLYIADRDNDRIRKVDASTGNISTIAGGGTNSTGTGIPAVQARLRDPYGVAVDGSGNVYIADGGRRRIRKVDTSGTITTVAGTGSSGFEGDGGPATAAKLRQPFDVAADGSGNLYIADTDNHRIRKVDAGTGNISTIAGDGTEAFSGDGGAATAAQLQHPSGIVVDGSGNLYIADTDNHRIRKVDADTGNISTVAGTGAAGYSGDNGAATAAQLNFPDDVAVDAAGNLYIADRDNHRIRKVDPSGTITTVAGTGAGGYDASQDGGPATAAQVYSPRGLALDGSGNLYISQTWPDAVRKVDGDGNISTVAGSSGQGYDGDNKPATEAQLNNPFGLTADGSSNLYIADTYNHRIRKVDPSGTITTVAGTGQSGYGGDGAAADAAQLDFPYRLAADAAGNLYIADAANHRIRKAEALLAPPVPAESAVRARTFELLFVLPQDAAPAAQEVALYAEDGGADFRLQPAHRWIAAEPASGSLAEDEETTITVTVDPAGLRVGTRQGRLYIRSEGRVSDRVRVVLQVLPPEGPAVAENGVVNAAVMSAFGAPRPFGPQALPLAPGSLVAVLGENFTSDGESAAAEGFPLPASLGGATVRFEGLEAPLFAVGPQRIEAQLPSLLAQSLPPAQAQALKEGGVAAVSVVVETAEGGSYPRTFLTAAHGPGVFTVSGAGTGQAAALLAGSGALAAPRGHAAGSRPARAGDVVEIYATGLGPVYPPIADGENSCGPEGVCLADGSNMALRRTAERPRVSIGGVELAEEAVLFSGLAPALAAVNLVVVEVPAGLEPSDAAEAVIAVGGRTSQPGVTIAVE